MNAGERYTDKDGFVRKPREWGDGLLYVFMYVAILNTINPEGLVWKIIVLLVATGLLSEGITKLSSHVIRTWKPGEWMEVYIYVGCLFLALPGILVYYYFKAKEKSILKSN